MIDWEMAAVAPGLMDLAALTAGDWTPDQRATLECAYADVAGRRVGHEFAAHLDACRLALCIQWLGWRPGWQAPAQHTRNWLDEALTLADRLEL